MSTTPVVPEREKLHRLIYKLSEDKTGEACLDVGGGGDTSRSDTEDSHSVATAAGAALDSFSLLDPRGTSLVGKEGKDDKDTWGSGTQSWAFMDENDAKKDGFTDSFVTPTETKGTENLADAVREDTDYYKEAMKQDEGSLDQEDKENVGDNDEGEQTKGDPAYVSEEVLERAPLIEGKEDPEAPRAIYVVKHDKDKAEGPVKEAASMSVVVEEETDDDDEDISLEKDEDEGESEPGRLSFTHCGVCL